MTFLIDADHEHKSAIGAGQLAVVAHQGWRHGTGRHDIRFRRESAEHENAEAEHDNQIDSLAYHADRGILQRTPFPGRLVIRHGASISFVTP